ncbi:MAG: 5'-3' exonuclease [Hydrogenothermaceae bacterium]|nr:5'-3' exonuclease [Hydrogenothermaceae bacterium]
MKRLLLIDSSSYIYRAFYALPPLTSPKGIPTGAIYGFVRMLLKLLNDFNPEYVAAVFDSKGKTIRHMQFTEYKANRKETPDSLSIQIPYIKEILNTLNIKIVKKEGFEADDIIATLAKDAEKKGFEVIVVTPDKDMLQLVNDKIKVFNPVSEILYDSQKVKEKYGIEPNQFVDYLSLIGDPVDNVPGIKGVGPKTASELLNKYGSIENILQNLDKLPEKYKKLFENIDRESIEKSKQLVNLYQTEIEIDIEDLKKGKPDLIKLKQIFDELGFKSLMKDVEKSKPKEEIKQKTLF